ncbi:AraC family ligand binding domain-containing protein [Lacticaseibacillus yichunensis]|uniref:AraC family ligand binding domain-containing protein n=1 Tax=Lacticaseibacillus yichunensis TaxID=2486015 RepID=A0ABW4CPK8_9LACO|nr:AraC family ligand binding domain-containing protein [Lacticaseibacillus yichunensis]
MEYQKKWFGVDDHISVMAFDNFSYPLHFHRSLEMILLQVGTLTVLEPHQQTLLKAGHAALILPNQLHGYQSGPRSHYQCLTFAPSVVPTFMAALGERHASTPALAFDLFDLTDRPTMSRLLHRPLMVRGLIAMLCDAYLDQPLVAAPALGSERLGRIIDYLGSHYTAPLTLPAAARALGYNPSYLSRLISREQWHISRPSRGIKVSSTTDFTVAQF